MQRHKSKLKIILSSLFISLFFPSTVSAQVVINEVFPDPSGSSSEPNEFIELFNSSPESVTITGWSISDTEGSTKTYTIPETTLSSGGFAYYRRETTGIALNNTGDGVELKDSSNLVKDSMSFDVTIEDRSWSKIPNGSGSFVNNTTPTEGAPNSNPPSPTLTPSPTPTNTPTPTLTSTPTPTPSPKPTVTTKPTATPKITLTPTTQAQESILATEASSTGNAPEEDSPSPTSASDVKSIKKFPFLAAVFISVGLGAIGLAVFSFLRSKKKGYNGSTDGEGGDTDQGRID